MSQRPTSFADKYGRGQRSRVQFSALPEYNREDLVVERDDDMETIAAKANNAYAIVIAGGSLAVALDLLPPDGSVPKAAPAARDGMTEEEKEMFDDFLEGADLPGMDKQRNRAPVEGGERARKRDARRLKALQMLYDDNALERENLAWYHKNHPYMIPLLTAAEKMIGAEKKATDGGKRDARELAELQAANLIASASASRMAAILEEQNRLKKSIAFHMGAVQARRVAMQPPPEEGRKKAIVRFDEVRVARGKERVGGPRQWNREGAMGRVQELGEGLRRGPIKKRPVTNNNSETEGATEKNPYKRMRTGGTMGVGGSRAMQMRRSETPQERGSPSYTPASPRETPGSEDAEMEG